MAQVKGDYSEVEQTEKSMNWKQSVRSAARRGKSACRKELNAYNARQKRGPWRKPDPPSDKESHIGNPNASRSVSQLIL